PDRAGQRHALAGHPGRSHPRHRHFHQCHSDPAGGRFADRHLDPFRRGAHPHPLRPDADASGLVLSGHLPGLRHRRPGHRQVLDPAITAGAVISGAYFGDKLSPLSDTTNLAPAVAGTDLFAHVRHMTWTTLPSLLLALIGFALLAVGSQAGAAKAGFGDLSAE